MQVRGVFGGVRDHRQGQGENGYIIDSFVVMDDTAKFAECKMFGSKEAFPQVGARVICDVRDYQLDKFAKTGVSFIVSKIVVEVGMAPVQAPDNGHVQVSQPPFEPVKAVGGIVPLPLPVKK